MSNYADVAPSKEKAKKTNCAQHGNANIFSISIHISLTILQPPSYTKNVYKYIISVYRHVLWRNLFEKKGVVANATTTRK